MRAKTVLAAGAMVLSLAAVGSAKAWHVMMESPTKAGTVMLPAGPYKISLNNDQAIFRDTDTGKEYSVPVKVQNAEHKYDQTAVETQQQSDGSRAIHTIDLGGTTEELGFGE